MCAVLLLFVVLFVHPPLHNPKRTHAALLGKERCSDSAILSSQPPVRQHQQKVPILSQPSVWKPLFSRMSALMDSIFSTTTSGYNLLATSTSSTTPILHVLLTLWLGIEIIFYCIFHFHLVPHANRTTPPTPYRQPFGSRRVTLLEWILDRILADAQCNIEGPVDERKKMVLTEFLLSWFHTIDDTVDDTTTPAGSKADGVSSCGDLSSDGSQVGDVTTTCHNNCPTTLYATAPCSSTWTIPGLTKPHLYSFLAWVLFAKDPSCLDTEEQEEMEVCFRYLEDRLTISYDLVTPPRYQPRRMTLEDVRPWHRPLLVYIVVRLMVVCAGLFLRLWGFRPVQSSSGLPGWVRPRPTKNADDDTPLIFFHGIAPGGFFFYIPFLLNLIGNRPCLLLENRNISCIGQFHAVSEEDTVHGVQELLDTYLKSSQYQQKVTLVGHSFGSCPITWLLHNHFAARVRDVLLLDPVTILLSNSDVMINFLYSQDSTRMIRMVASSELFTEYYLRRHFSWYNSELWLAHVPSDIAITVALAQDDEIVAADKVREHCCRQHGDRVKVLYWEGARHAAVVWDPRKWRDVREASRRPHISVGVTSR